MLIWYVVRAVLATLVGAILLALGAAGAAFLVRLALDLGADGPMAGAPAVAVAVVAGGWAAYLTVLLLLPQIVVIDTAWYRVALRRREEARAQHEQVHVERRSGGVRARLDLSSRWPLRAVEEQGGGRLLNPDDLRHIPVRDARWIAREPRRRTGGLQAWLDRRIRPLLLLFVVGGAVALVGVSVLLTLSLISA